MALFVIFSEKIPTLHLDQLNDNQFVTSMKYDTMPPGPVSGSVALIFLYVNDWSCICETRQVYVIILSK